MDLLPSIGLGGQQILLVVFVLMYFFFSPKKARKGLSPFGFSHASGSTNTSPLPVPFALKQLTLDKAVFYLVLLLLADPILNVVVSILYYLGYENSPMLSIIYKILNIGGRLLLIWVVFSFWYLKWQKLLIVLSLLALAHTLYYTFQ